MLGDTTDETIAVVGPGRMGAGIAQVFAMSGSEVRLLDTKPRPDGKEFVRLDEARESMRSMLELLTEAAGFQGDHDAILNRVRTTRSLPTALEEADWLFEALPEDPDLKRSFFDDAAEHLSDDAIIGTTTSSISLDSLEGAAPDRERILITHWWNPPPIVPLVEVATAEYTDDAVVEETIYLLETVGKAPIECADSPGFIGTRIQAAAMNEAIRAYEEGVASAEAIDQALKTGMGFRMPALGVIEHVDLGGIGVLDGVNRYLNEHLGERFQTPQTALEKIEAGEVGTKTARGFYDYEGVDVEAYKREKYASMLAIHEAVYGGPPGEVRPMLD
jgi:3-hydroxybutyryl-CoA dehydrogenase